MNGQSQGTSKDSRPYNRRATDRRGVDRGRWQDIAFWIVAAFSFGWLASDARARQLVANALERGLGNTPGARTSGRGQPPTLAALVGQIKSLTQTATTDALTGVGSRQRLMTDLHEATNTAQKNGAWLALCMVDIDHFKAINDEFGHDSGDVVLRQVAQRMRDQLRSEESIARYGGEEFVLVFPKLDVARVSSRAELLRQAIERDAFVLPDGTDVTVTCSFGVAASYGEDCRQDTLLSAADRASYQAKNAGRNIVSAAGFPQTSSV